jgi:hypothetical protein
LTAAPWSKGAGHAYFIRPSAERTVSLGSTLSSARPDYPDKTPSLGGQPDLASISAPVYIGSGDLAARLIGLLNELEPENVRLGDGQQSGSFLMQTRSVVDSVVVFVSNQEGLTWDLPLHVGAGLLPGGKQGISIRRLNLENGEYEAVTAEAGENGWTVPLHFAPYESHLIEFAPRAASEATAEAGVLSLKSEQ